MTNYISNDTHIMKKLSKLQSYNVTYSLLPFCKIPSNLEIWPFMTFTLPNSLKLDLIIDGKDIVVTILKKSFLILCINYTCFDKIA